MNKIDLQTLWLIVLIVVTAIIVGHQWNKHEQNECARWKNWVTEKRYDPADFDHSQVEQCKRWGVELTK